jgi:hypothetical protein
VDLVRFLLEDAEHGAANREVLSRWIADWQPLAEDAARAARVVFDELPAGISFDEARANVQIDLNEMMNECGLSELAPTAGGGS